MLKEFLSKLFKNMDLSKISKMYEKDGKLYDRYFKAKPNALLGDIPLFVISTNF